MILCAIFCLEDNTDGGTDKNIVKHTFYWSSLKDPNITNPPTITNHPKKNSIAKVIPNGPV